MNSGKFEFGEGEGEGGYIWCNSSLMVRDGIFVVDDRSWSCLLEVSSLRIFSYRKIRSKCEVLKERIPLHLT